MKLKQLKALVDRIYEFDRRADELEVCIPINRATATVGARACTIVKNAGTGIDWDSGKFFIYPTEKLAEITEEEIDLVEQYRRKLDIQYSKVLQNRSEIKKEFLDLARDHGVDEETIQSMSKELLITGRKR